VASRPERPPDGPDPPLETVVDLLQRRFGVAAPRKLSSLRLPTCARPLSTGFADLDEALGGEGIPRGSIVELVGVPTSGLATLALLLTARSQQPGEVAVIVDLEETFDPDYAARCGVSVQDLLLVHAPARGHVLDTVHELISSGATSLVVMHSIETLLKQGERPARVAAGVRRVKSAIQGSECCLLSLVPWEANLTCTVPAYANVRLLVEREAWLEHGHDVQGYQARVTVLKNQFAPAGRSVSLPITINGDPP